MVTTALTILAIGAGVVGVVLFLVGWIPRGDDTPRRCAACARPVPERDALACPHCGAGMLRPGVELVAERAGLHVTGITLAIVGLIVLPISLARSSSAPVSAPTPSETWRTIDDRSALQSPDPEAPTDAAPVIVDDEISRRLRNGEMDREAAEAVRDAVNRAHLGAIPEDAAWTSRAVALARYGPYEPGWIERISDQYVWLVEVEVLPSEEVAGALEVRAILSGAGPPAHARWHQARVLVHDIRIDGDSVIEDPIYCTCDETFGGKPIICRSAPVRPVTDIAPGAHRVETTLRVDWMPFAATATAREEIFVMGGTMQERTGRIELAHSLETDPTDAGRETWPTIFHACVLIRRSHGGDDPAFFLTERQIEPILRGQILAPDDLAYRFTVDALVEGAWHALPPRRFDRAPRVTDVLRIEPDPAIAMSITRIRLTPDPSPADRQSIWIGPPVELEVFDDEAYDADRLRRIRAAERAAYERRNGPITESGPDSAPGE